MRDLSAVLAVAFGLFLAVAEAYRNWGDWQWWPFWVIDYICAVLLIAGGWQVIRGRNNALLLGGWGVTFAAFWSSFFTHVREAEERAANTFGPDGSVSEQSLTIVIGVMLVLSVVGFFMGLAASKKQ